MRRPAVVCTALLLAIGTSAPAGAAPTDVPAAPPSLEVTDRSADGATLVWQPSSSVDVTAYQVQVSQDGAQTWGAFADTAATVTQYSVGDPPAGRVVFYRVVAENAAGASAPTNDGAVMTSGTTSQTFTVRMPDGRPVTGGEESWSADYATWHTGYALDAHGHLTLSGVPAGVEIRLRVSDATIAPGQTVDKGFQVAFGTQPQTIVVPDPPAMESHRVTVLMPGGVPAVGVEVDAGYYQGLTDFVQTDGYTYADFNSLEYANTGADGSATVRGWSAKGVQFIPPPKYPYPQQAIYVIYNDSVLHAEALAFLTGDETVVQLAPLPWTTTTDPAPVPIGDTAIVRFQVHPAPTAAASAASRSTSTSASTAASVAGVHVTLKPPAGWSASACPRKTVLTGVTDAHGYVTLPLCAPRNTQFSVRTIGALPSVPVTVSARKSAPGQLSSVLAGSPARGELLVKWGKPVYSGGAAVTRYRIVATSPGHSTVSWLAPAGYTSHAFTHLARGVVWAVTVSAVSAYGTGPARTGHARVQ